MRGGLLRGKPPLLFLRSGILAGQGSFLYAESRNKQNWRDIDMPNTGVRAMRCASCCSTSRTWIVCWARMSAARKRNRSMIASNGHAPKAFRRNAQPHIYVCSKGFRGAAPDKQRAVFRGGGNCPKSKVGTSLPCLQKLSRIRYGYVLFSFPVCLFCSYFSIFLRMSMSCQPEQSSSVRFSQRKPTCAAASETSFLSTPISMPCI